MADTVSKKKRSEIMSRIRGKDTQIEVLLRGELSKRGLRYRKNVSYLAGKPDIVFIKKRLVIFLDSCFWHGCRKHCRIPAERKSYWLKKIKRNKERDKEVNKIYRKKGWKILRLWEHRLKKSLNKITNRIVKLAK